MTEPIQMDRGAMFSPCEKWRYKLWRVWNEHEPQCMFLMLNPSTADEVRNDPTVERCERYARAWGYGGLHVCNIFAYRATDPTVMKAAADPIGPDNDRIILNTAIDSELVVCAWGNHGSFMNRSDQVIEMLHDYQIRPRCLKVTGSGEPGHPLYLKKSLTPILYTRRPGQ